CAASSGGTGDICRGHGPARNKARPTGSPAASRPSLLSPFQLCRSCPETAPTRRKCPRLILVKPPRPKTAASPGPNRPIGRRRPRRAALDLGQALERRLSLTV